MNDNRPKLHVDTALGMDPAYLPRQDQFRDWDEAYRDRDGGIHPVATNTGLPHVALEEYEEVLFRDAPQMDSRVLRNGLLGGLALWIALGAVIYMVVKLWR